MAKLGHDARLIAPQYVKPFVKRQKNDAADAEAIVIAARQPEMRFVSPKTEDQQARAMLFRGRERLVHQLTELVNALRAVLYEYGHACPVRIGHLKRIEALIEAPACDLPALITAECRDLAAQIAEKTDRIDAKTNALKELAAATDTARRLQNMPGIGAGGRAPDGARGRGFRARHGAVQTRPGFVRRGNCPSDSFLFPLTLAGAGAAPVIFRWQGAPGANIEGRSDRHPTAPDHRGDGTDHVIWAMTGIMGRARHKIPADSWLGRMLARKPKMLVAIALAGKMARQLWAMLTKNTGYRDPALATTV